MRTAETILEQLGGQKFLVMTGAKSLLTLHRGLTFQLKRAAKDGINCVQIIIEPEDTYRMEFCRVRKFRATLVSYALGVQANALQEAFTQHTGLYTHL